LVKVDVEGHGHRALAGMHETLGRHRPHVLIELHSQPESEGALAILEAFGYTPTLIGSPPAAPAAWLNREVFFRRPG
jgi:hypothetical protein